MRQYYVYILASRSRTIYIGITNDLLRRVYEHKHGAHQGFTQNFRITSLVHYEIFVDVHVAITREKQLKRMVRWRKERMIEAHNPDWRDLSLDWLKESVPRPAIGDVH